MSKLRKKFITVLAVLFCALLTISTALFIPKSKSAEAASSNVVGEIYDTDTNRFNVSTLQDLYNAILDGTDKTLDNVATAANAGETALSDKGIQVEFGGMQWIAVYLSKASHSHTGATKNITVGNTKEEKEMAGYADNGDIVLTLWLANSAGNKQYNTWVSPSTTKSYTYPSNMYGTSYMRSVVLNNGGKYSIDKDTLTTTSHAKQPSNQFAKFTMPTYTEAGKSYNSTMMNYLVAPRYIGWQYEQYANYMTYYLNNDSWGPADKDHFCVTSKVCMYYYDIDGYSNWKDDLIWIPSMAETGYGLGTEGCGSNGMWNTNVDQRMGQPKSAWQRSADETNIQVVFCVDGTTGDRGQGWVVRDPNDEMAVRPALHLNLTKADEDARKVFYDGEAGEDEKTYEHVYDGEKFEQEILDSDMLVVSGDNNPTSPAEYTDGKFSAKEPKNKEERVYDLVVKPNKEKGFYWDDWNSRSGSDDEKKYGTRTYKIKIKLAEIKTNSNWKTSQNCTIGGDLLQGDDLFTLQGGKTPTIVYHKEYDKDDYPEYDSNAKNWGDGEWSSSKDDFEVKDAGYYRVYYKVSAEFHETKIFSYEVRVTADDIKISVKEGGTIPDLTYGDYKGDGFITWLKGELAKILTVQGSIDYDTAEYINNLEIVLRDDKNKTVSPQENGYYPAGTYTVDFKDSPAWDTERPKLTINPAEIVVKVVAATDGDKLTHVYGDKPAALKIVLSDGTTKLSDGGEVGDLAFGNYILKKGDDELVLDEKTPVCKGKVIADASKILNYKVVDFETTDSDYEVTQRTVKLFVADETVGYGTDFTKHEFKLKFVDGESLVNNETLSKVITSLTYTVKSKAGVSFKLDESLSIGEYVLNAAAEAVNYKFEITAGTLTVEKGTFDMSGVDLENAGYIYDGEPHPAKLSGELPSDEITVSYRYVNYETAEELDGAPVEVGQYLVYATFTHGNSNYNIITDVKAAFIRIAYTQEELNQAYPDLPTDAELAAAADLAKKKTEAKKTLDEEAQKKKDEIDADVNLSAEEKKAAKDEIDKELKEGNAAIDKAKDKDGVDKAYDDGKKEIEDTTELAQKKGAAKSELDKAAQAKKDAIDNNPELTDEEKAAAKAEVDKELEEGKKAIDGANSIDGVSSAESSTKTNIENIKAEHKGSFPWWILAIIAGAILLVTVLIIVIVKRRNADDDDGGYDDFYDDEYDYDEEEIDDDGDEAYGY